MKHTDTTPACIGRRFLALPAMLVVSAVLLFVSCTNLFEKEIIADSPVFQVSNPAADTVYLAVSVGDFSRAAFPTDLSVLNWTISITKADVISTVSEAEISADNNSELRCSFPYAGAGDYSVTINGSTKTDPAEAVCTGRTTVYVPENASSIEVAVTVTAADTTVTGDISLKLAAAEGSAVTGFSVQCTSDTDATATAVLLETTINSASETVVQGDVAPGVYTMTINAYADDATTGNKELVYVRTEKVTVCPGLTTDMWVMADGKTSGTLTITADMLFSTFYVAGGGYRQLFLYSCSIRRAYRKRYDRNRLYGFAVSDRIPGCQKMHRPGQSVHRLR